MRIAEGQPRRFLLLISIPEPGGENQNQINQFTCGMYPVTQNARGRTISIEDHDKNSLPKRRSIVGTVRDVTASLVLVGICVLTPQPVSALEPATLMAAAGTAKTVADKAMDFLKFTGFLPGTPDPLAGLKQKLADIKNDLDKIQAETRQILEIAKRVEDHLVFVENEKSFKTFLDGLENTESARIAFTYFVQDPSDRNAVLNADQYSHRAIADFEKRPEMFRLFGPTVADFRFNHVIAYSGYLSAVALRVAFIEHTKGKAAFMQEPYQSELRATAKKMVDLVAKINEALEIRYNIHGVRSPVIECTHGSLTLVDHIVYDREQAEKPTNQMVQLIEFQNTTCEGRSVKSQFRQPTIDMRQTKADAYGSSVIKEFASILNNYAAYGQPDIPDFSFGDSYYGTFFSKSNLLGLPNATFIPSGPVISGVPVILADASAKQRYRYQFGNGPIEHVESKLCLDGNPGTLQITLEQCDRSSEQMWTVTSTNLIQHHATGSCLSAGQNLAGSGIGISLDYILSLEPCNPQSDNMVWTTLDPAIQPPR